MPRRLAPSGQEAQNSHSGGPQQPERAGALSPDLKALLTPQKQRKYRNVPVEADGYRFDSTKERDRYFTLKTLAERGEIHSLEIHPRFPLVIHGIDTGDYVADFAYVTAGGQPMVEDVKSVATRKLGTYQLKRRQVWALYTIKIWEIT